MQACVSLLTVLLVYRLGVLVYSRADCPVGGRHHLLLPGHSGLFERPVERNLVHILRHRVCLARARGCPSRKAIGLLLAAGLTLGLAALTRSIMLLFVPFLAMYLLWAWPGTWNRRAVAAILPVFVFALVISPWAIRNTRLQETLTIIDVMGGRNAMMGNYEYTPTERSWATISDVGGEHAWHQVLNREVGRPEDTAPRASSTNVALSHAIRFVLANPGMTLKRDVVKFFNFWQLERTFLSPRQEAIISAMRRWRRSPWWRRSPAAASAAVLLAAMFGICCTPPANLRDHLFLLGSILFPCADPFADLRA